MKRYYFKYCIYICIFYGFCDSTNHALVAQDYYGAAWIVGYSNDSTFLPKYGKTEINFSSGNINVEYKFGEKLPELGYTNASIGNKNGTLRYFTDGFRIYDNKQKSFQMEIV